MKTLTIAIITEGGRTEYSALLNGMPICPTRATYAEILPALDHAMGGFPRPGRLTLWDGSVETGLPMVPRELGAPPVVVAVLTHQTEKGRWKATVCPRKTDPVFVTTACKTLETALARAEGWLASNPRYVRAS